MEKIIEEIEASSQQSQAWNMVDGNEDTCWFSSHGESQTIDIHLSVPVYRVWISFQKEFHCTEGRGSLDGVEAMLTHPRSQSEGCLDFAGASGTHLRIVLERGPDIYGRFCIYGIRLEECTEPPKCG